MPATSQRARPAADETARLRQEVRRLRAELARSRTEKAAIEAVCHEDALTELLNRRGFLRDLERSLSYARRYRTPAALLLLDLDRFKSINDTYGHGAGDQALRRVAACLRANLRASDVIGRLGGDEFAILLWQVDEVAARTKADALEAVLADARLPAGDGEVMLGGSVGTTALRPDDDVGSALARADRAMYARKAERHALAGR